MGVSQVYIFLLGLFQQVQTKNLDVLHEVVVKRPSGTPLVTVSNHTSCLDDPVIWGMYWINGCWL